MTEYANRNFSFKSPTFEAGDEVTGCNLTQAAPGTALLACAAKAIRFARCNLTNVAIDPAWTVEACNTTQISRCTHLHPELLDRGVSPCADNCEHVADVDTVRIDGVAIETIYQYADKVVG